MNLAYDLFQLTFNLSQLHDRERIIQLFIEGLQEIFKPSEFVFSKNPIASMDESFELKSRQNHYGYVSFRTNTLFKKEHIVLICNAIQMVAAIINNLDYGAGLEDEKEKLNKYVELKLSELKNTVKELEDARTASINLIEDLSEEIEKRKLAEADLKNTQLILKATLESPADMIILAIDLNFNYLSFNNVHKAVMQAAYGSDVKPGMNLLECMTGEEDILNAKENYARAMKGESFITVQEYGEKERSYYETYYNSIKNEKGEIVGATAFSRNITNRKRSELALKESETKFRNLFEHSPIGKSMTGIDGSINVNKAFCDTLGYSPDELKSKNWKEISHPDDIPGTNDIVKSLISGKSDSARFEKRYLHKNGSTVYADVSTYLQRDNDGNPKYFITTISDITKRRMAEIMLREEKERIRTILDLVGDPIFVKDNDHRITLANRAFFDIFCLDENSVIGYTLVEAVPENERQHFLTVDRTVLDTGIPDQREEDLTVGDLRRTIITRKTRYIDESGKKFLVGSIHDITDRKLVESKLLASQERYSLVISASEQGIWDWNVETNEVFFSEQWKRQIGYEDYEIKNDFNSWIEHLHPDEKKSRLLAVQSYLNDPAEHFILEFRFRHKDGSYRIIHNKSASVKSPEGKVVRMFGTHTDITDQKQAEEEIRKLNESLEQRVIERTVLLRAANSELEAFSYSVSHDLRAPLRAIHSYTNILREDYKDTLDDEGRRICGIIESSSVHMGELIDDLLLFSRVGRTEMKFSCINMTKLANTVYSESVDEIQMERINLNIKKLPSANGDLSAIRQVFVNLITNAIKYTSKTEKPAILIGCDKINGDNVYFVKDNGVGFDMLYVNKLFGVFQRLHSAKEFEGNGVGLAIVQRIIHRHGGKVWAEAEVGKGATFYFTLPDKDKG